MAARVVGLVALSWVHPPVYSGGPTRPPYAWGCTWPVTLQADAGPAALVYLGTISPYGSGE